MLRPLHPEEQKIQQLTHELSELLSAQKYDELIARTEKDVGPNPIFKRIMLHHRALAYVYMGALNKARSLFLSALKHQGENIGLIRDLSCCYYQMGEIDQWRNSYTRVDRLLKEKKKQLSFSTYFSTALILGKFLEEEGQVHRALEVYQECLADAQVHRKTSSAYLQTLPQLMRLKALFNQPEGLAEAYKELISSKRTNFSKDLNFEVQHSLMLTEMVLIGPDQAWARVEKALDDPSLPEPDRRLIYYDFIEEALVRQHSLESAWTQRPEWQTPLDTYEQELHRFAFEPERRRKFSGLSDLAPELSWACYLRLLVLYLAYNEDTNKRQEIKNKIHLILGSLQPASRAFWCERMKPFLGSHDLKLKYRPHQRSLEFQNKRVDLSRKRGMLAIIEALRKKPHLPIDEAIDLLWGAGYSPESYHRLRMNVHRLNQILFDLTAIQKVIEVNSDVVTLKLLMEVDHSE